MARLNLDYALKHISEPFEPLPDDQGIVNDVTVHRRDGSFVRLEQETGALSTQAPPAGVGRYETELTVDTETDAQLSGIAGWIRSHGTFDAERFPRVHVNMARHPSKIADVMAVDTQDRLVIDNPPAWFPPEDIDLIIEGYTEEIGLFRWDWTANTSPGGIYSTVGVYGPTSPTVSRYDSAHSTLAVGVSAVATALTVVTGIDHALWVTGSGTGTPLEDTFTRSTSNGWGTSDSGHAYTHDAGAASDYSVTSTQAEMLASAASVLRRAIAGPSATDGIIRATLLPIVVATGASFELGLILRRVDIDNMYAAEVRFLVGGTLNLRFVRTLAGAAVSVANVALSGSYTASTQMRLVFEIAGSELRAKAWRTTDSEPIGWQLTHTDTNITAAGVGGCVARVQSGNTNVPLTVKFDGLLYVPQLPLDVICEGIRLPTTAITNAVTDTFTRTVTDGWGSADTGQVWTTSGGNANEYNVNNGVGHIGNGSVGVLRHAFLDVAHNDFEHHIDCIMQLGSATGASWTRWVLARMTDTSNYYVARLTLTTSGTVDIDIFKRVGGTVSVLSSGGLAAGAGANAAGNVWRTTFKGTGTALEASVRNLTTSGATTTVTGVDASLTSGTKMGVAERLETGNTNTLPVTGDWDNFEVVNPQTFTVIRNADLIDKALAAGSQVRLWRPARYGL